MALPVNEDTRSSIEVYAKRELKDSVRYTNSSGSTINVGTMGILLHPVRKTGMCQTH